MAMNESVTEAHEPASAPPSSKLRWVFLIICGALLAILSVSGLLAFHYLRQMYDRELAITQALEERAQMLTGLSLSIQRYNQDVQKFVTEARADREEPSHQHLDQLTLEIESDLKSYPAERDSAESSLLDGLRDVFSQQRTFYISVLGSEPDQRRRQAQSLMAQHIVPLQQEILDWSAKLRSWNDERLNHVDRTLVTEFAGANAGLTRALAIGFGSGFLLVLAGTAYILRLERQTQGRYAQLAQNRRELQQLSSRLVDAQETERRSISRELHDEVGQALGALMVDLGRLSAVLSNDRPEVRAQLENMKSVAERTFQAVRNIALLLRPSMLDDLGLVAALEWQGREVSRRSEIEVEVQSENVSDSLPDEYRVCIYRLVQEALSNTVRHSGARNAKVFSRQSAANIVVKVSDDGKGFNSERSRGLGLLGMEERVKRLGGTFTVQSQPGHGVTLTANLPFPPRDGGIL
jgi:signal transduction histidine kinase